MLFYISIINVRGCFKRVDLANAVILVVVLFVFFEKIHCSSQNLLGCWIFEFPHDLFVRMDVKSYPFDELIVNLASWTPSNFG